jgi:hypothetical protein
MLKGINRKEKAKGLKKVVFIYRGTGRVCP